MIKYNVLLSYLISVYIEAFAQETEQVDVRAVLISCEPFDGQSASFDNEAMRFEREELFKHSVLRDCRKKIALTVKIASDTETTGDEYIPIEHVFQGQKKRVRLLNPYVLRLRRDVPLQAYKLRKIDTVSGILTKETTFGVKRNSEYPDAFTGLNQRQYNTSKELLQDSENCEITPKQPRKCLHLSRSKRHENSMEENSKNLGKLAPKSKKESTSGQEVNEIINAYGESSLPGIDDNVVIEKSIYINDKSQPDEAVHLDDWKTIINEAVLLKTPQPYVVQTKIDSNEPVKSNEVNSKEQKDMKQFAEINGKPYDMYEIGNADLWYTIQVQLFEKMSTPDGKTVWNDLTRGDPARVSSLTPEWIEQHMSIRYRSSEWIPRSDFTLPTTSMCLLAPVSRKATTSKNYNDTNKFIMLPRDDVVGLPSNGNSTNEHNDNKFDLEGPQRHEQSHRKRRVVIRTSRALFGGADDKVNIAPRGADKFLTLPHRQPYHAQIDLEARADDNQLIHVGSFGRIMTVVADSSRRTRTVLTVQATNTGLVAASFKVVARECNPEIPDLLFEKVNEPADSFKVLPPKHTQSIRLDVPTEMLVDLAHCSVVLINGDGQSVAVRDVTIRKGDRCFCVWHCECVCLGDDPKLRCREMTEAHQIAAGLSLRETTRHVRSVCYHDVVALNLCFTALGVLTTLLMFGMVKAFLGLMCRFISTWGLTRVLQMPRKLDHYYEIGLKNRKVVYDSEGWPVHPDTKERTIRVISMPMEFFLNCIFFITAPGVIIYDALKQLFKCCQKSGGGSDLNKTQDTKHLFSTQDMQGSTPVEWRLRRRWRLQRWMTPQAENLTSNVLQNALPIQASMIKDCMQPLLHEECCRGDDGTVCMPAAVKESYGDSEVDDTEYVLMQMQKSRESLARSQRKLNGSVTTSVKRQ